LYHPVELVTGSEFC